MRQGAEGRENDVFAAVELCETRAKILEAKAGTLKHPVLCSNAKQKPPVKTGVLKWD